MRVVDCQCRRIEVVKFLLVGPVSSAKHLENLGSGSKTLVGWGLAEIGA